MNQPAEKQNNIKAPSITLPKGGGAINGIGETFQPDAFTGTSSYKIPFHITQARGLEPNITLAYNSGNGNSAFGLGFSVDLPKFSIRTEKGIPQYNNTNVYLFNGQELVQKGKPISKGNWIVSQFRPRIISAFKLIEHYVNKNGQESHWEVTSNTKIISKFGISKNSKICNHNQPSQIFEWLIEQSIDSKGNKILFTYKSEDDKNVPNVPWEINRSYNNKYIQNIKYGNYKNGSTVEYAYQVVFDYGEYNLNNLDKKGSNPFKPVRYWSYRSDSFSSYKSGFEIRTRRLCQNILLFHNFKKDLVDICLVKQLNLKYINKLENGKSQLEGPSMLDEATLIGCKRNGSKLVNYSYDSLKMPPISFKFSKFKLPELQDFKTLEIGNRNIPGDLKVGSFQPIDLDKEGIPGLLYQNKDTILYYEPKGDGQFNTALSLQQFPNLNDFANVNSSLQDLDGNGELELVVNNKSTHGFYQRNEKGDWMNYDSFIEFPTDLKTENFEYAGLSNNGKTDAILVENSEIKVYPSKGKLGYAEPIYKPKQPDFPSVKKDYPEEFVGFEDLIGDGLPHRIKVKNGSIECWPDLGYGDFDKKITLGNAPYFGEQFDASRLFFADIDGSGTNDIIYVYDTYLEFFNNQSGNSFSNGIKIPLPENYSDTDQIRFMDVLGNGTTCLVFSKMSKIPKHYYFDFVHQTYLDNKLQNSMKPYMLQEIDNNLGTVFQMTYCSSVKTYLEDKASGNPWITKLPFPVQVIEKIVQVDKITNSRYTSSFKFHDGFYDHVERKFQGFGYVETWDSETYQEFTKNVKASKISKENFVPPIYTRTWHNTGAMFDYPQLMDIYRKQFFQGDKGAYKFPDSKIQSNIFENNNETIREAYTSLQGHVIRSETYADDKNLHRDLYKNPYVVKQSNLDVKLIQSKGDNPYAVFMLNPRESITYHYERNPNDPRVQQKFTIKVDDFGNPIQSCVVNLARRSKSGVVYQPNQTEINAILNWNTYVTPLTDNLFCHKPCENQQLEISGLNPPGQNYFSFDGIASAIGGINLSNRKNIIPYGHSFTSGIQARQISWNRTYFWNLKQTDYLPLKHITDKALLHHEEHAIMTKDMSIDAFDSRLIDKKAYTSSNYDSNVIYTHGGYFYDSYYWWNKGLTQTYFTPKTPEKFYLPTVTSNWFAINSQNKTAKQDPSLCSISKLAYDKYYLFPIKLTRVLDKVKNITNVTKATIDYISGQSKQLIDANNNTTQLLFDPLGQVIVTSLFGTENGVKTGAMRLYSDRTHTAEYTPSATKPTFNNVINKATSKNYLQGASTFFYYNLFAWVDKQQPVASISLIRNNYWHSPDKNKTPYCKKIITYSNGLGQVLEKKLFVDPGMAYSRNALGKLELDSNDCPLLKPTNNRWQVTGRTVYNNKGKAFEQYLPYFINTPNYEDQEDIKCPPPTVNYYDPLERVIRIDTPKGFFSKVEFTPWEVLHYDTNDTVLESNYYKTNYSTLPPNEKDALTKAAKFFNTPKIKLLDTKGSVFREIENNLGNIIPSLFDYIKKPPSVTSQDIWNALLSHKYIVKDKVYTDYTWLTDKFQPYTKGFDLNIGSTFSTILKPIIHVLIKNCLTSYIETDILGRTVESTDPRLYYSNIKSGKNYYNFKYQYPMGIKTPLVTNSIDAGEVKHFSNIFNKQLWSWTARNYCQFILYDTFQRKTKLTVKKIKTAGVVKTYSDFNQVEIFTYRDGTPSANSKNLNGQLIKLKDLSGFSEHSSYTMLNKVLKSTKQTLSNHKTAANWNPILLPQPKLDPEVYKNEFTYNAVDLVLTETTPDDSVTTFNYNQADQLNKISLSFKHGAPLKVITHIEYDAQAQKTKVIYGNGIVTNYNHESTTLRLIGLKSTRATSTKVQDIKYYYDPEGNITRTLDKTIKEVFTNNNSIKPLLDYKYDALYRLIYAKGRQHKGINANTYKNNTGTNKLNIKQSMYGPTPSINDPNELENYTINYKYDNSGNLVKKTHKADKTGTWVRTMPVELNSNRLKSHKYDHSGNLRQLDINNKIDLSFNCCENLVKAGIIQRPSELDDCDYYLYDSNEIRVKKVSERMVHGGSVSLIEEKTYLGNYEIKRQKAVVGHTTSVTQEIQTLRIMDASSCVAIIHTTLDKLHPGRIKARQSRFQMGNNLGSISLELDTKGFLITYEEYFPYGGTAITAGKSQVEVKLKEYRYSGKERDDSTGLYYYGARYYLPWMGRWLKPDPAGTVNGMNLYAFVKGNPIRFNDPTGTMIADTADLISDVRYLSHKEFEQSISIANEVFNEAYANKELFTNEEERFSKGLENKIIDFVGGFSGAFAFMNSTLNSAIEEAGGQDGPTAYDARESYKRLRTKSNKTLRGNFTDIDFDNTEGPRPFELHHIKYKKLFPNFAVTTDNLALTTRGSSRSGFIGTHEGIFHVLTSGNDSSIYTRMIAGMVGIFKRIESAHSGVAPNFIKGAPYSLPKSEPVSDSSFPQRSKSRRTQSANSKKRELGGGGLHFFNRK